HEIKGIHQLKRGTIHSIVIASNGLVETHVKKELENIKLEQPEKLIALAQKAVILGICRTVRR
ncbi:hypothetical protein HHI36_007252, partial [Cryptolaemus montrouzieri]